MLNLGRPSSRTVLLIWDCAGEKEINRFCQGVLCMPRRHQTPAVRRWRVIADDFFIHDVVHALAIRPPNAEIRASKTYQVRAEDREFIGRHCPCVDGAETRELLPLKFGPSERRLRAVE